MAEPAAPDDAALVRGTLAGRREDFDMLVARHQRALYGFAYRFVHDHEQAADVVQSTFLQAYAHLGQFAGRASFATWLHQIALNQCRALARSAARARTVSLDAPDAPRFETPEVASGWHAGLERLIARLPLRQRAVLTLRVFSDLPFREIARIEGITENAAKVNYHHAIKHLRRWLAGDDA